MGLPPVWGLGWGDTGSHEVLYRHDAAGWQRWSLDEEGMLPSWGVRADEYAVAPDGSLWANWTGRGGISRFDGRTWAPYLPGTFVGGMDVAPDGSVWLTARDKQEPGEPPDHSQSLYVITPQGRDGQWIGPRRDAGDHGTRRDLMRTKRPLLAGMITLALLGTLPLSASAEDKAGDAVDPARPAEGAPSVREPIPSLGCGHSDVEAGLSHGEPLIIDGEEREWSLFVPQAYDGMDPVPLWVQLHGNNLSHLTSAFLIAPTAEKHSFVVVAPQGDYGNPSWLWRKADHDVDLTRANPDLAFVEALVAHLGQTLCLDLARVYAVGDNQGGYAVTGLACVLEDHLAAVATVSGMYDLGERCVLERPVPLLGVHGRNDPYALFDGGSGPHPAGLALSGDGERMVYGEHPIVMTYQSASIPTRMEGIALRNGCEPGPTVEAIGDEQERWTWNCPAGAEVELVTHEGGYQWPIGEPLAIDERIWEFFEQHPMPE